MAEGYCAVAAVTNPWAQDTVHHCITQLDRPVGIGPR